MKNALCDVGFPTNGNSHSLHFDRPDAMEVIRRLSNKCEKVVKTNQKLSNGNGTASETH